MPAMFTLVGELWFDRICITGSGGNVVGVFFDEAAEKLEPIQGAKGKGVFPNGGLGDGLVLGRKALEEGVQFDGEEVFGDEGH